MLMLSDAATGGLFLALMLCVLFASCAPDLIERVKAYGSTYNAHDMEKLMAFYTDDIRFGIIGVWVKQGRKVVRELAEWDRATNLHMSISDISVSGNTVTFKLVEANDWWKLAGMGEVHYEPTVMIFRNGLISDIRAKMTQDGLEAFARIWPLIINWARQHRADELMELLPGGEFIYKADAARKWLVLLREWRAATEQ